MRKIISCLLILTAIISFCRAELVAGLLTIDSILQLPCVDIQGQEQPEPQEQPKPRFKPRIVKKSGLEIEDGLKFGLGFSCATLLTSGLIVVFIFLMKTPKVE